MWGFLAKFVLGLPGLADGLFGYLNKRSDNTVLVNGQNVTADTTVAQAQLTAYVEERKVIASERARQSESIWTAWMIPCAFFLAIAHFGAIVFCSIFQPPFAIAKLPPPYDQLQWTIIASVIGVSGVAGLVKRIFK